jgi:hypothetical protein
MGHATGRERRIVIRWRTRCQSAEIRDTLHQAYPAGEEHGFDEALDAIDKAERDVWDPDGTGDKLD